MMLRACPREAEVSELAERGQWPHACAPELRAHAIGCRTCSDVALVTRAFQRARNQSMGEAKLGSPGMIWWRAQLRRRNAAVERISKPILSAQIFALAVNLLVAVTVTVWQARHGLAWLTWLEQLPHSFNSQWFSSLASAGLFGSDSLLRSVIFLAAPIVLALLGGTVIYFNSEER